MFDKLMNWLGHFFENWMKWWKTRGLKFNMFDESMTKKQLKNPFNWMGGMLYILLILQVIIGIVLTFFYIPDTSPVEQINPDLVTIKHGRSLTFYMKECEEMQAKLDAGEIAEPNYLTVEEQAEYDKALAEFEPIKADLESKKEPFKTQIDELTPKLEEAKSTLKDLEAADPKDQAQIDAATSQIADINAQVAAIQANIDPLQTQIDAENARILGEWTTVISERADFIAHAGKTPEEICADMGVIISRAYQSVAGISSNPLTRTIRGVHRYGAYAFIALLMLRWLRMYFNGEFKKPGELTWIIATLVVVVSTFSGVTGYLLPFDQRSYWATTVGTQMLDSVDQLPVIGAMGIGKGIKFIALGAHQVGQTTILRFNILHYLLPIAIFLAAELYFLRSRKKRPKLNWIMFAVIALVIIGSILYLPAVNEPPPNTVKTPDHILPDWYFLFVYFYLKFLPGAVGPILTVLFIVFLLFMPVIDRRIEKEPKNRPSFTTLAIGGLTFFLIGSIVSYWVPFKDADRALYINTIVIFNGLIFALAFVLEYLWLRRRRRLLEKKKLELGVGSL